MKGHGVKVYSPIINEREYDLMDIGKDGSVVLMDDEGEIREDLEIPEGDEFKVLCTNLDNEE